MSERIQNCFAKLRAENRAGLVTFLAAGDPDFDTSLSILKDLPKAGADIIEIGMPFSDPMADGPAIQAASLRALDAGMSLARTLEIAEETRTANPDTPIVLMGYFNPIHHLGVDNFLDGAIDAGVDGLIIVDLPPEEDSELCLPAVKKGLSFIRLATPTTDDRRLDTVLQNASGFVYYVSITGITGAASPVSNQVAEAVVRLKSKTDLPIAVGFGIREPEQAAEIARHADASVVGTALVDLIRQGLEQGDCHDLIKTRILDKTRALSDAVRKARLQQ